MKNIVYIILAVTCFFSGVNAQDRVELFGYFESSVMAAKVNDRMNQLFTNKLRVDLKSTIVDNITFAANFDYITYHGTTKWNIPDFLTDDITSQIPAGLKPLYTIPFTDRNFLDNAYLKIALKHLDITVGKQQISLGSGYVWNPLDVFNIKDPLDPTYEQPGHNAVRLDVPLGARYSASALYSADDNWKDSAKLLSFTGGISHFDFSLVAIETVWRFHDYTQFDTVSINFMELPEQRRLVGGSLAGELLGLGVWAEYGYNQMAKTKDFYELVAGVDYTFDFQTYFMVEYYRNTLGKTDYKQYDLNDWMRQFTAEQKTISRDQIYGFIKHPLTDFIDLGASCICSISDGSLALIPTLNYSFTENVDLMAYLNFGLGKQGTAYSETSGNGGLLRARVYF